MFNLKKKRYIRGAFFDIDGTLLPKGADKVPESTLAALNRLREKHIPIAVSTGRSLEEFKELPVSVIQFDAYFTSNAAVCYNKNFEVMFEQGFDKLQTDKLVSLFNEKEIPIKLIGKNGAYINFLNDYVINVQTSTNGPIPEVGEYSGETIYQAVAFVDAEQKKKLTNELDRCKITSWNENAIDIVPAEGGKDTAVNRVLQLFGIKKNQAMAFGDGENDISMLNAVGISVAMGNASDKVKKEAKFVTAACDDDGIAKALKFFRVI